MKHPISTDRIRSRQNFTTGFHLPTTVKLIQIVRQFTDPLWIGLYGSAAGDRARFGKDSDIDLLVVHKDQSRYFMTEFQGRPVEISQYSTLKVHQIYHKPQWFGLDWLMEIGKFETAETIFGARECETITPLNRLIAIVSAIGIAVKHRDEAMIRNDQSPRNAADGKAIRVLQQLANLDYSGPKVPLENKTLDEALMMIDELRDSLETVLTENIEHVLFYPIHWTGARTLIRRWNLNLKLPQKGTIH